MEEMGLKFDGWLDKAYADQQREGFCKDLARPLSETAPYRGFQHAMTHIGPKAGTILDVGCGTGGYAVLVDRLWSGLTYRGCDISPLMIEYAKEDYGDRFFVCDVLDLHEGADIIFASSLIEVSPNWQEILAHLLALPFQWLILSRVRVWHDFEHPTSGRVYECVYGSQVFEVTHNMPELEALIKQGGGVLRFCTTYQVEPLSSLLTMVVEKEAAKCIL